MKLLVTGGAGFIGSAVCRYIIEKTEHRVVNLDKLTYAANLASLTSVEMNERYRFYRADVYDNPAVEAILALESPDAILHLAAESHVDRSISGPETFIETNIVGTYTLLEAARRYWLTLSSRAQQHFRFLHVSTDEVYGSLGPEGLFTESTPYDPSSPYAASKAASDHLALAWHRTYGLPVILSNCSNNYGPYHFPEKLIPLMITNAILGRQLPVYGAGANVRDWLYVDDHVKALFALIERGVPGESYNIGGRSERANLTVVQAICGCLDKARPRSDGKSHASLIRFVADRPGHDLRYAIDPSKIERELGWAPHESFDVALERTVRWYLDNEDWWQALRRRRYDGERLGLSAELATA